MDRPFACITPHPAEGCRVQQSPFLQGGYAPRPPVHVGNGGGHRTLHILCFSHLLTLPASLAYLNAGVAALCFGTMMK